MDDFRLLIDLHKRGDRQGPGGNAETELALRLMTIDRETPLTIADIGCGTGASTLVLAQILDAQILAVDFLQDFLDVLLERATCAGVAERISTLARSMDALPFADEEFDIIWSEGAIYHIGFEKGVTNWRRFLKTGGFLVASEITWLTDSRPAELHAHWATQYPEIDVASAKLKILEQHGYAPVGYFTLPEHCWLDQYYRPLQARFGEFLQRHEARDEAQAIVAAEQREMELYETYKGYYSYGM